MPMPREGSQDSLNSSIYSPQSSSDDEIEKQSTLLRKNVPFTKEADCQAFDDHLEMRGLQTQIDQLQRELAAERENMLLFRKKLMVAKQEKFEQSAKFNGELIKLRSENAGLSAKLERQTELTEELHFDIDKAKMTLEKQSKDALKMSEEKCSTVAQLQEMIKETEARLAATQSQNADNERSHDVEISRLKDTIADRDRILQETIQEQQGLLAEKNTLNDMIKQQQESIEHNRKVNDEMKAEFDKTRDHLLESNTKLEVLVKSEEEAHRTIEELKQTNKELLEAVESERTAHLESKFNGELVQLKIHDLENTCQNQKCVNDDLQSMVESLKSKLQEMEQALDNEVQKHRSVQSKLERCEKEYALSQRQLQSELTDKRSLVSNLKQQLDVHQNSVDDLKTELNRAKKRQKYFEETYGSNMRELELIVMNYATSKEDGVRELGVSPAEDSIPPHMVPDTVKSLLKTYRDNLDRTTNELKNLSHILEQDTTENKNLKDRLWAKEKALEETQKALSHSVKDVEVLRQSNTEQKGRLTELTDSLQRIKSEYDIQQQEYKAMSAELTDTRMTHLQSEEEKVRFIHGIYQRLSAASTKSSNRTKANERHFERLRWDEIKDFVLDSAISLINENERLESQISKLEKSLTDVDKRLDATITEHKNHLENIEVNMETSRKEWIEEKLALQQEYKSLLADYQEQQQLSQKSYDDSCEQARLSANTSEQLQKEVKQCKSHISVLQKHNIGLLSAFNLICGAYFPLVTRNKQLVQQRTILEDQMARHQKFRGQICTLLQTLRLDDDFTLLNDDTRASPAPLLRFRASVIAVIAANRLRGNPKTKTIVYTDSENFQGLVTVGSFRRKCFEETDEDGSGSTKHHENILDWLSNKEVISLVLTCTEDVTDAIRQSSHKGQAVKPKHLLSAARVSLKKLIDHMSTVYLDTQARPPPFKERNPLVKLLARGLNNTLPKYSTLSSVSSLSLQNVVTTLQEKILGFVRHLHDSEVERKELRLRITQLDDYEELASGLEDANEGLKKRLIDLKNQLDGMVTIDKFETVTAELDATLRREKEAQSLLQDQTNQLRELQKRLGDEQVLKFKQENEVKRTMESMDKAREELSQKSKVMEQLKTRLSQLELERTQLRDNIYDAEQALSASNKDKERLAAYIKQLASSLENCRHQATKKDISKVLVTQNVMPDCQPTGDMLALQSLVNSFTESLRLLYSHIKHLDTEIWSYKQHIGRLKDELSAACNRQLCAPLRQAYFNDTLDNQRDSQTKYELADMCETEFTSIGNEPDSSNCGMSCVDAPISAGRIDQDTVGSATQSSQKVKDIRSKKNYASSSAFHPVKQKSTSKLKRQR